jgi:hypothetical protein
MVSAIEIVSFGHVPNTHDSIMRLSLLASYELHSAFIPVPHEHSHEGIGCKYCQGGDAGDGKRD